MVLAIVLPVTLKPVPTDKSPVAPPKEVTPPLVIVVPDIFMPSPETNKIVPDSP